MILRVPDYYEQFHCLAGDCGDSCCIGWEIDIDEESAAYYQGIRSPFGDRLRERMQQEPEDELMHFGLQPDGRCAFLDQGHLCEIYRELGEEALCEVCTEYPRFTTTYGDVCEKSLTLSCEAVGQLVFSRQDRIAFTDRVFETGESGEPLEEAAAFVLQVRDAAIRLLQDRSRKIESRICTFLEFNSEAQELLGSWEENPAQARRDADAFLKKERWPKGRSLKECGAQQDFFAARMHTLSGMELLGREWEETRTDLEKSWRLQELRDFLASSDCRETEYEQLMVYEVFRYFSRAVYDWDLLGKARFAVFSYLVIRDLDAVRYHRKGSFSMEDRIATSRIYAREVEHSEENLEYLAEEFVYDPAYEISALRAQILLTEN